MVSMVPDFSFGILYENNNFLLVREGDIKRMDLYRRINLTGGSIRDDETPREAIIRKFREETGLYTRADKEPFYIRQGIKGDIKYNVFYFNCYRLGGKEQAGEGILEILFVPFESLISFKESEDEFFIIVKNEYEKITPSLRALLRDMQKMNWKTFPYQISR